MCGIAGALTNRALVGDESRLLTGALAHRGPDAEGAYHARDGRLFLGHRRLSVIDLSVGANQPMHSHDGRYVMVYNGEVYNFAALRDEHLRGVELRTHGDSEVVLELFARHGAKSMAWLNGMFALAIHDRERDEVFLCRDGLGIKPLFVYAHGGQLAFASELKAVRSFVQQGLGRSLPIDRSAVPLFLHLGFIPETQTIYEHVSKFPAGHHAIVSSGGVLRTPTRFWDPRDSFLTRPITDEGDALPSYRAALFEAVGSQMISDVPLGTFLSGGIDSSLVTAVAQTLSPRPVKTFSIGFEEARYDESKYAAAVAAHLRTEHHPFRATVHDVLELVPSLFDVYDEPFADSSAFPTMLVSKLARQHVTVTLSGDGGDELFQGYGMYAWARRLSNPVGHALRRPIFAATRLFNDRWQRAGTLFDYDSRKHLHGHVFSQEQYYFSERELGSLLLDADVDLDAVNETTSRGSAAERQAFWDLEHYLKDDLLVKVDRASMRYSLETRVPLLDKNLVEFALNLDLGLKTRDGWGSKYLMKKVLYDLVPRSIFERPKRGFSIPLQEWLLGPLSHLIDEHLAPAVLTRYGFVDPTLVTDLVGRFRGGTHHLYNRIWVLVVLHWWLAQS